MDTSDPADRADRCERKSTTLEIAQRWGDLDLDTRLFRSGVVWIGARRGWRWRVLGVDMGLVPEGAARILPWCLPLWSDVEETLADDFLCQPPDGEPWALARHVDGAWWLEADARWPIGVRSADEVRPLDVLAEEGRVVREGDVVRVRVGEDAVEVVVGAMTFAARLVEARRVVDRPPVRIDAASASAAIVCLGIGVIFGAVAQPAPAPVHVVVQADEVRPVEVPLQVPEPVIEVSRAPTKAEGSGRRARDRRASGGGDRTDPRQAGILGSSALDALGGDSALDAALARGIGGLIGARGVSGPSGGLGLRRGGLGGGGDVDALGGVGRPGGPGGPGGPGDGWGKEVGGSVASDGEDVVLGGLSREAVDEVVRNHLAALRYCYQRELSRDPGLHGKVTTRFVVAADGTVSSAEVSRSSLGHVGVERCVAERFLRMRFPTPRGGGIVVVSYPLVFSRG